GPFVNGSSVTISELDADLNQTGKTYFTTISDNLGSFEQKNIELVSNYVELKVDGYYFNEVQGKTSVGQMTLYALVDITAVNSANVNVLTHLEKPRVEYLVKQGIGFAAAKKQAQREVLAIFGFDAAITSSESLNLTTDTALLALSCILQGALSTGDMMELMANISADIKTDGKLDNKNLGSRLINNASVFSSSVVRDNLANKYAELDNNVVIPDFESYIQSFLNSNLYQQTAFITYPASGSHGLNILSDDVTSVQSGVGHSSYSMKADVPEGFSLKIIIKNGRWFYVSLPAPLNWTVSEYDQNTKTQVFTVTESGKPNDLLFIPDEGILDEDGNQYITIEYYENGTATPSKTKRLYLE
ncbi:MAG: hypothetical protein LBG80_18765, partial [Bacteroidales bacterium]|nr:hypothetical protein [Bacteroidales bacterium]